MSAFFERVRAALAPKGYDVLRELGSGGMGIVVLALHVKLDRLVAVKVIRPELHTAVANERFLAEAKTLASLSHPNIVPVYDADEADGLPYYAMKYLDGATVADHVRKGPLPPEEVRKLGRDLLDALEFAHTHGVIHRDVKPANVFWDGKSAVLVDFGIAKRVPLPGAAPSPREERLTEPGVMPGTRGYMSPEQMAGAEATAGSDLFAAALVIYEAYTARHWFDAHHPVRRAWSGIPGPEARVLRSALAWKAERRFGRTRLCSGVGSGTPATGGISCVPSCSRSEGSSLAPVALGGSSSSGSTGGRRLVHPAACTSSLCRLKMSARPARATESESPGR